MDLGYIQITGTVVEQTSETFELSGDCKIIADTLVDDEYVILLEERPNGTYKPAVDKAGIGVVLNSKQPSQLITGYGYYKLFKSATSSAVAVAAIIP